MNNHQIEAIANANAHLSNACLPTYDDFVSHLEKAVKLVQSGEAAVAKKGGAYSLMMNLLARAKSEKFVVVNAEGRFYTTAGNATWSLDEALAQTYDGYEDASVIASLESGSVVPSSDESRRFFAMPSVRAA
jgi:hypothetical protein